MNFGKVNRRDADAVAFENFFRITNGVERAGPRADRAEAHAAHAIHHAADAEKFLQVALESCRRSDAQTCLLVSENLMPACTRLLRDGNFSAERIAAARGRKLLQIVGITLDQNRHVELATFSTCRPRLFRRRNSAGRRARRQFHPRVCGTARRICARRCASRRRRAWNRFRRVESP